MTGLIPGDHMGAERRGQRLQDRQIHHLALAGGACRAWTAIITAATPLNPATLSAKPKGGRVGG